jgi:hypothetical protein
MNSQCPTRKEIYVILAPYVIPVRDSRIRFLPGPLDGQLSRNMKKGTLLMSRWSSGPKRIRMRWTVDHEQGSRKKQESRGFLLFSSLFVWGSSSVPFPHANM